MIPLFGTINKPSGNAADPLGPCDVRFDRILVGTDFSQTAERALKVAVTIGTLFGSRLSLVNAVSPYEAGPVTPDLLEADLENAREEMRRAIANEPRLNTIPWEMTVSYCGAEELIHDVAVKQNSDLITVGSHGASGLEKLILGSVAEAVLRKAPCPVLVIGPNVDVDLPPFGSILFATDLETTGLRAAQYALALAEKFNSRLTLLHVIEKHAHVPEIVSKLIEHRLRQDLEKTACANAARLGALNIRLEYGTPSEVISTVALLDSASLIVVGLKSRTVLDERMPWSTLSHVIRQVKCGVLGVRGHVK